VRLGIQHALLELPHQVALFGEIGLPQHAVIKLDLLRVLVIAVVRVGYRVRQILGAIQQRIDHVLAIAVDGHGEIARAHRLAERAGLQHALGHAQPDLGPLVDGPNGIELVRLVHVAVEQLE